MIAGVGPRIVVSDLQQLELFLDSEYQWKSFPLQLSIVFLRVQDAYATGPWQTENLQERFPPQAIHRSFLSWSNPLYSTCHAPRGGHSHTY